MHENEKNLRFIGDLRCRDLLPCYYSGTFIHILKGSLVKSLLRLLVVLSITVLSVSAQPAPLLSGPMVGYGTMTEVMLWVQTSKPSAVQYRYWNNAAPKEIFTTGMVNSKGEGVHIAKTVISGLSPGTKFIYELLLDGKPVKRPYPLRFQTQPLWQWRTDPPTFTVAFGSCNFVNEPAIDRPGKPYGSDFEIFSTIAAKQPDLFIWGGDNTYLREVDWDSRSGIIHRHTHTRSLPELQPLLGGTHNLAIWDDHDFGPNDADRTYALRKESLEIYEQFWANRSYGTSETDGTFSRFVWNDVEFFLLDDRYDRSPNDAPTDEQKTMFGKEQLQWLKDALTNSAGNRDISFRIIVNGNQILNTNGAFAEMLTQFPSDYNELLGHIRSQQIPGILFLSGDRHLTELIALKDSSFYTLYDFTSSALTSGLTSLKGRNGEWTAEYNNPLRVEGTLVNDKHNFGMLTVSGKRRERVLTMECYDLTGARRWSRSVPASELQVPR